MHSSTREYEACVLVNSKPVTEVTHNSRTYIEGRKDSVYELRFTNKTNRRVLIVPSVDGLNVLDGKPCGVESNGYVVNAYGSITIPGWTVDNKTAAKFVFKPQGANKKKDQTYVEAIDGDDENQGVIGFLVFQEKPKPYLGYWDQPIWERPPWNDTPWRSGCYGSNSIIRSCSSTTVSDSYASNSAAISTSANANADADVDKGLGTGFGKATDFGTTTTTFTRKSSMPDVVFSFFYDTLQNLKKAGVPVNKFQPRNKKKSKGPNPFPNSPDLMGLGCVPPKGWKR